MSEFRMPSLGADMEAGTLVEWVKHPGDAVKRGDIIAVVDTQKGAIEIEVFEDGVLEQIVVAPGQKVPVGTILAHIRSAVPRQPAAAEAVAPPGPAAPVPSPPPPASPQVAAGPAAAVPPGPHRARVSPVARKLAAELGIDLEHVTGSGPQGAIGREDVERAAAQLKAAAPPPAAAHAERGAAMRAAIAAAMARSKREIPHYYLSTTIDMSKSLSWLRAENEQRSITERLIPAALLIKAVALALREVPELNGYWRDDAFQNGDGIHVGCAVSLRGGGLVAPGLHNTDTLSLTTLMRQLQDLVARARSGSLKSSELSDPTITVTNLGEQAVESVLGVIYPPQVALVGFGRIVERPWVVDGALAATAVVTASLAADHRVSDGHRGAVFLARLNDALQRPQQLEE
jgi:pyruvate dehydrogenase E2 component (dihydrolipoyllysine-residue acetyltransferase)